MRTKLPNEESVKSQPGRGALVAIANAVGYVWDHVLYHVYGINLVGMGVMPATKARRRRKQRREPGFLYRWFHYK